MHSHSYQPHSQPENILNSSFQQGLRALLLSTVLITGCESEANKQPGGQPAATTSGKLLDNGQHSLTQGYFFSPPLIAPEDFSMVTASAGGFTKREAYYLNNAAYFLKCALQSERPDLVKEFDKVQFLPFTSEMATMELFGADSAFGLYERDNYAIHINTKSPSFLGLSQAFFPLARTVAHEFCHHLAGDKITTDLGADATPLFTLEIAAHHKTQAFGKMARNFLAKIDGAPEKDIEFWQNEIDIATTFAKAAEDRYLVRRDVCQKIFNLVNDTGTALKEGNVSTVELDHHVGGLMVLAAQLRDAAEDGQDELRGYRVLVAETAAFAVKIAPLNETHSKKLLDCIDGCTELLLNHENLLLEVAGSRARR